MKNHKCLANLLSSAAQCSRSYELTTSLGAFSHSRRCCFCRQHSVLLPMITPTLISTMIEKPLLRPSASKPSVETIRGELPHEYDSSSQDGDPNVQLAHGRASDALHDVSHEIMDKQEAEIEQMIGWLQEWHGQKPAEMNLSDPSLKKSTSLLEKLKQLKGAEFDKLFVQEMTSHHLDGIQLAELAKSKADHP